MRKGQEDILRRTRKYKVTEETIALLSRADLTLEELNYVRRYILRFRKKQNESALVAEAERCLVIAHRAKDFHRDALIALFHEYHTEDKDSLLGSKIKERFPTVIQFFLKFPEAVRYYGLHTYIDSLYLQLPVWHTVCLTGTATLFP